MKILYLSCHSILEFDEVKLFHELGYEIFSPGAYVEPRNPGDASLRPGIPGLVYNQDLLNQFHKICGEHPGEDGKDYLTKEFVDNFDTVIVMHLPRWIHKNWEVMKHKRVIWRTIGQSISNTEQELRPYRNQGLQIVRYSPREVTTPGFIGQDAMIRFYKDPNEYKNWNGNNLQIITFAQHMKNRGAACNFDLFEQVTRPFPRHLYGPGNEGYNWSSGKQTYEQQIQHLQNNRCYFYTGTHPASYTLNFIEAFMIGIPIVAIGPQYGNASYFPGYDLYEIPDLIQNNYSGFISNNLHELQLAISSLLSNATLAQAISQNARQEAIRHFGKEHISLAWKAFLGG